jgi:hypothetical protein
VLKASRKSWYDYNYQVTDDDAPVGQITLAEVGEHARLLIEGQEYSVAREGMKVYKLETQTPGGPAVLAAALRQVALYHSFRVDYDGASCIVAAESLPPREFNVLVDDRKAGVILLERSVHTPAEADLPADIPAAVRAFILTLTLFTRKHSTDYAAMTATVMHG